MADKPFQMPPIEVGRIVLWYRDGHRNSEPSPAIVTQFTNSRIAVAEFPPGVKQHMAWDGVMHIDDPRVKQGYASPPTGSGAWDYTDFDKRMMALAEGLEGPPQQEKAPSSDKKKVA